MSLLSVVAIGAFAGLVIVGIRSGLDEVRRWLHVLWVCRVSVASVAAGILLADVVQAQDVFAETSRSTLLAISYWIGFCFLLFLSWAFPVHFAARRILEVEDWALGPSLLCDESTQLREVIRARYRAAITWVPRILGFLCFAASAWATWAAWTNLHAAASNTSFSQAGLAYRQIPWILGSTLLTAGLFGVYVFGRHSIGRRLRTRVGAAPVPVDPVIGLSTPDLVWFGGFLRWLRSALQPGRSVPWNFSIAEQGIAFFVVTVLTLGFLIALIAPFTISDFFPRAMFLVSMLGSGVFLFTFLAALGHRYRWPIIATIVVLFAASTAFRTSLHEVRLLEPNSGLSRQTRQVQLKDALERWKAANRCGHGGSCQPIIAAGQGGASRAGFYTGTVLADLLDRSRSDPATYDDFGTRLFALSTVSGSSVGAVVVRAALEDAGRPSLSGPPNAVTKPPCRGRDDGLWFGGDSDQRPWRSCLQSVLAGDFLSPTFVGLAYRDNLAMPFMADRATLLEKAWERRYARLLEMPVEGEENGLERRFGYWLKRLDESGQPWLPLLFLNGTSVATGRRIIASDVLPWRPSTNHNGAADRQPIFPQAFDLFEILASCAPKAKLTTVAGGGTCPDDEPDETAVRRGADIRLSTAATMSARFPIISPSGALPNAEGRVVEDVVDGGYFENDGLITARELAKALHEIDGNVVPIIIHITNDPDPQIKNATKPARPGESSPALPLKPIGRFLVGYTSAVIGLYDTRQGHGAEAANAVVEFTNGAPTWFEVKAFSKLAVADTRPSEKQPDAQPVKRAVTMEKLSMSWWLSQPVQEYLDAQLVQNDDNRAALEQLEQLLRKNGPSKL